MIYNPQHIFMAMTDLKLLGVIQPVFKSIVQIISLIPSQERISAIDDANNINTNTILAMLGKMDAEERIASQKFCP